MGLTGMINILFLYPETPECLNYLFIECFSSYAAGLRLVAEQITNPEFIKSRIYGREDYILINFDR